MDLEPDDTDPAWAISSLRLSIQMEDIPSEYAIDAVEAALARLQAMERRAADVRDRRVRDDTGLRWTPAERAVALHILDDSCTPTGS